MVGGSGELDNEMQRLEGRQPPMERHQWLLGPALLLGVVAAVMIFLAVTS